MLKIAFISLLASTAISASAIIIDPTLAAAGESYPVTLQKQCSIEFQKQDKATRGGFAGWQTYYKECRTRHKAAGSTFAKRAKKS